VQLTKKNKSLVIIAINHLCLTTVNSLNLFYDLYHISQHYLLNLQIEHQPKETMITITEKAKSRLINLMQEDDMNLQEHFVRVGVTTGGCSGLSYQLDFDREKKENDHLIEVEGIKIVVDKKSVLYLAGTSLNYSGGLNGKGFVFENPNASRTCGCGESFSL
jgi:iron-sulfur cluster assembly protein